MKKRGLGGVRGLDMLMGNIKTEQKTLNTIMDNANADEVAENLPIDNTTLIEIDVQRLQSGKYQPRRQMNDDALKELSLSIAKHGVMQPIVIRTIDGGGQITHEIVAGERRWRAAKLVGLATIPAIVRQMPDEVAIALALIENIQREDLNVLEQAAALQRFNSEFGMSHAMIAEVVGKARTTVSNLLRLNQLHPVVKDYMNKGLLDMGHARTLLSLSDEQQPIIAKKIIDNNMTVRDAEKLVKSILNPEPKTASTKHEISRLNQALSDKLGVPVKCRQDKQGRGSVELFFGSNEELLALLSQFEVEFA